VCGLLGLGWGNKKVFGGVQSYKLKRGLNYWEAQADGESQKPVETGGGFFRGGVPRKPKKGLTREGKKTRGRDRIFSAIFRLRIQDFETLRHHSGQ